MDVIITKKYSLSSQPFAKLFGLTIGLIDSDEQTRSFYKQKLQEVHLEVLPFTDLVELQSETLMDNLHAVILGLQSDRIALEINNLKKFLQNFPQIPIITISKTMQEAEIDAIMKLGTRLHINRDFSHPRDLVIALEQIL